MMLGVILSDGQFVSPAWRNYSDPYAASWVIVGLYGLAALLCMLCVLRRRRSVEPVKVWRYGLFWMVVGLGVIGLGLNKQLDLHVRLMDNARPWLDDLGWYDTRKVWLPYVVFGIALFGLALLGAALLILRGLWSRVWLVVLGAGVLCLFVFQRGFSIWVTKLPFETTVLPRVQINHVIEIAGIALIIGGALLNLLRRENRGSTPQSSADMTD